MEIDSGRGNLLLELRSGIMAKSGKHGGQITLLQGSTDFHR